MADRTIFKYPLDIDDQQTVHLPAGARILDAQFQGDQLCLWALVEPGMITEPRDVLIVGTGHPMPPGDLRFIATVQTPGLPMVWHVFEPEGAGDDRE